MILPKRVNNIISFLMQSVKAPLVNAIHYCCRVVYIYIYISSELSPNWENIYLPLITAVIGNKKVIFPVPVHIKRSIMFIKTLFEEGHFKAVIHRTYPLKKIAEAYEYVGSGQKIGNVVITLEDKNVF